jgi:hypothetical protein
MSELNYVVDISIGQGTSTKDGYRDIENCINVMRKLMPNNPNTMKEQILILNKLRDGEIVRLLMSSDQFCNFFILRREEKIYSRLKWSFVAKVPIVREKLYYFDIT